MADLKENFKKWLIQQGTKSGTITSYLSRLQKISHKDWDNLTSNIIPFLVKYYELANKEYYLDCITILQALKYFNTISDNIYKNTNITNESDIKLYLFDGKKDYFICDNGNIFTFGSAGKVSGQCINYMNGIVYAGSSIRKCSNPANPSQNTSIKNQKSARGKQIDTKVINLSIPFHL